MSDNLDLFRNRVRVLLQDGRQQVEQARKPFDPGELLKKLLGMNNQPVQLAPGTREKAEQFVVHNIGHPASEAYLKGYLKAGPWPAEVRVRELQEQGLAYELDKMGSKGTLPLPVKPQITTPAKKKNWREWLE